MPEKKRPLSKKAIILIFFIIALISEVYIFNFRYWTSLGNKAVSVSLPINKEKNSYGDFSVNLSKQSIVIKNIGFYFDPVDTTIPVVSTRGVWYNPDLPARITISYTKANGESSSFTKNFPYNNGRLCVLSLNTKDIKTLDISYDDAYLTQLFFNTRYEFSFSLYRFCLVFLLLCFIYIFRAGSGLWKEALFDENLHIQKKFLVIHLILCAVLFIFISSLFFQNPFFKEIPDLQYFYPELARSFAGGHTYDQELPSRELLDFSDPYNLPLLIEKDIDFKLDRLLYNGRYYTYFGPLPCVLFYLPYYLITGQDMPHWVIIEALLIFFMLISTLSLTEAYKRYYPSGSAAAFYTGFLAMIIITPMTSMAASDTFPYYIPIFMSVSLFLAGLYFYLKAANTTDAGRNGNIYFALGSASIALIAACRPSILIFTPALAPLLLPYAVPKKENLSRWVSFLSPVIIIAVPVLFYNYVRFGNPLDYGYAYQLTIDGHQTHPTINSALVAILHYFLRPIYFTDTFPYVKFIATEWSNPEGTIMQAFTGGVFILYPILIVGLKSFIITNKKEPHSLEMQFLAAILIILSVLSSIISSISGGFTIRYRMDFSSMTVFAAVIMLWQCFKKYKSSLLRNLICILLLISSFNSFTQLFGTDLVDHSTLSDTKSRYEQTFEFWR